MGSYQNCYEVEPVKSRRRLTAPLIMLANELQIPVSEDCPRRLQVAEPDIVEKFLNMNGIGYVIGASCVTQTLWCALGYYLYKRCTASKQERDAKYQAVPSH